MLPMKVSDKVLFLSIKRLIQVLTVGRRVARSYAGVDLHKAEIHVLEVIGQHPGVTASQISEMFNITKGAVSQLTAKLLAKDVVEKHLSTRDIRAHELHLTPLGSKVFEDHEKYEEALVAAILAKLETVPDEQMELFASIIDMVSDFADQ